MKKRNKKNLRFGKAAERSPYFFSTQKSKLAPWLVDPALLPKSPPKPREA